VEEEVGIIFHRTIGGTMFVYVSRVPCCPFSSGESMSYESPSEGLDYGRKIFTFPCSLKDLVSLGMDGSGSLMWELDLQL
jgi:hypothetical protein